MGIRRVVTGHTTDGKAVVVSDSEVDAAVPEGYISVLWGADETPAIPDDRTPQPYSTFFPPVGGFRFSMMTVLPASSIRQPGSKFSETMRIFEKKFPDFAERMQKDNPGMHQSDTIDCLYIISGEVWMELDDGKEVHLKAGDTVVQNGTNHAWRNKGTEPCTFIGCLIGANRK